MDYKKILKGTFLAVLLSIIFMFILAIVVYFANLQERTVSAMVFLASAVAVFLGAFFLARNIESKGLLNGLLLAVFYFVILLILSLAVNKGITLSLSNFLRLISCLASGALGGVLGINTGK